MDSGCIGSDTGSHPKYAPAERWVAALDEAEARCPRRRLRHLAGVRFQLLQLRPMFTAQNYLRGTTADGAFVSASAGMTEDTKRSITVESETEACSVGLGTLRRQFSAYS